MNYIKGEIKVKLNKLMFREYDIRGIWKEDITEEEFEEAYAWLKTTQSLTEDYQELELEF